MLRYIRTISSLVPTTTAVVYFADMAPKKTTLNELGDMLTHVVKHMATKDDTARLDKRIDKLDAKIDSVESNLAAKLNRLDTKLTKFEEHEIDKRKQLEVRVTAIEKHLGLDKKIAA
jgi:replicative DNA helicase